MTFWFSFYFCSIFFSIYRDIWGTISWSIWCSEHWCRHLGNARKAKQWLWCVTCISQALWHDLLIVTYCRFARSSHCGFSIFLRDQFFFAFTLSMIFVTFLSNAFLFIFIIFSFVCLHHLNRVALVLPSLFFFIHLIWFWVLVGLDFCPFQVDSSPPPFGKGAMVY